MAWGNLRSSTSNNRITTLSKQNYFSTSVSYLVNDIRQVTSAESNSLASRDGLCGYEYKVG